MRCPRCAGCLLWSEEYVRCANCGDHSYPPLPSTPIRVRCYYCGESPAPGLGSCLDCQQKMKRYRTLHPKKRKKIGPQLPVITEIHAT